MHLSYTRNGNDSPRLKLTQEMVVVAQANSTNIKQKSNVKRHTAIQYLFKTCRCRVAFHVDCLCLCLLCLFYSTSRRPKRLQDCPFHLSFYFLAKANTTLHRKTGRLQLQTVTRKHNTKGRNEANTSEGEDREGRKGRIQKVRGGTL